MSDDKCETAPTHETETRFAVVMYGGISLAIYIHGVAQELYHMVRATARRVDDDTCYRFNDDDLRGTEKVYRCLGEALNTKFVVDILSGTSAGGINAVFLAKALVNDRPMEFIKDFWIQQGDIGVLVNDKDSLDGLSGLTLQDPPAGLLNSQRFYFKLLEALKEMGSNPDVNFRSPYVRELDLNITTTDIRGLNLPIQISNSTASELRYKNVFKFYYKQNSEEGSGNDRNDFSKDLDPFLAFAARCTASIPPAFEAMQLEDITPILQTETFKNYYKDLNVQSDSWKPIYQEYLNHGDDFPLRSFGDGGYLDNKPFSHATDSLLRRRADFPVDRKLIYIEPSPEHPENKPLATERPDMLENILAALVGLPRQETIREDLKVIAERNSVINKIKHVLSESSYQKPIIGEPRWVHKLEWANKFLMDQDVLAWYGSGYITYHQLRVEAVLKDLSEVFAQGLGWSEDGLEKRKVHQLLHGWLDDLYSTHDHEKVSQNDILFRLDLRFRMRKHHFLQHILNIILLHLSKYLQVEQSNTDHERREYEEIKNVFESSGQSFAEEMAGKVSDKDIENYLVVLRRLKREMNNVYAYMRARERSMGMQATNAQAGDKDPELETYKSELNKLKDFLDGRNKESNSVDLIEKLTTTLGTHVCIPSRDRKPGGYLYTTFRNISEMDEKIGIRNTDGKVKNLLTGDALNEILVKGYPSLSMNGKDLENCLVIYCRVQSCLAHYYDNFEYYDMLTFPIQYGTDAGETDEVEVVRVSPEDATLLVDERRSGRKKLAGTSLSNFGAFFKKEWRENDILWGRLDAAEIILRQLLDGTNDEERERFVESLGNVYKAEFSSQQFADPKEVEEYTKVGNLPYNLAFQFILEEDLRPRDQSIFYKFLDQGLEILKPLNTSPEKTKEKPSADLQKIIDREKALDVLKNDLSSLMRKTIGIGADPLRAQIVAIVDQEKEKIKVEEGKLTRESERMELSRKTLEALDKQNLITLAGRFGMARPGKELISSLEDLRDKNSLKFKDIMRAISGHRILDYFKHGYEVGTQFEVEPTVKLADRGAKVFNRLLDGLSEKYPLQKPSGMLRFAAQILSTLVSFSMPKSFGNFLLENYWIWLVYAAEAILFLAGYFTQNDAIKSIASAALMVTIAFHLLIVMIHGWIARRKKYIWWFYPVELIIWLAGIYTGENDLARIGMFTLGITLAIHAAVSVTTSPSSSWWQFFLSLFKWVFGMVVLSGLIIVFYLGLVYLGILPLWDVLAPLLKLFQGLPTSNF